MKCEVYLNLLEEYLDGELSPDEHGRVAAHLITCAACAEKFAELSAEQELYARYDRNLQVPAHIWTGVAEQIVPVAETSYAWWMRIAAVMLLTIGLGSVYFLTRQKEPTTATTTTRQTEQEFARFTLPKPQRKTRSKPIAKPIIHDNPDVLSSDLAYLDIEDRETADHIEQTQILLRSIRNFQVSDSDEEVDVTYDKALSRRLLNENVVLRRDAEMKAKFPTKTLLADLEPFLIDIANLPDRAKPEDVRVIKERVQKTEIVAALTEYRDRGTNNR